MLYLAEVPDGQQLANLYGRYGKYKGYVQPGQKPKPMSWWLKAKRSRTHYFVQILETFGGLAGRRLCEIGAAYGGFLQLARFRGAKVVGVELDDEARQFLSEELRIPTYRSISEVPHQLDTVCAKSVLEHVVDPGQFVEAIASRIAVDGCLLLSMPNGAEYARVGPTWVGFRVDLEHLNYFSLPTLVSLLRRYGFFVEQYWELNQPATARPAPKRSLRDRLLVRISPRSGWSASLSGCVTLAVLARRVVNAP